MNPWCICCVWYGMVWYGVCHMCHSITLEEKGIARLLGIDYGLANKEFPATLSM
jgi:hypothetical protein